MVRRDLEFRIRSMLVDYDGEVRRWHAEEPSDEQRWLLKTSIRNLCKSKHNDGDIDESLVAGAHSFLDVLHRRRQNLPDPPDFPAKSTTQAPDYHLDDFIADLDAATRLFAYLPG
ncbi:hypothetical protein [Inquilinus sp.]|uniref:hypothetical protein n=1 Tax=Inquilinus sp. TaxID=1932117 RepID=UPI0031CF3033